MLAIVRNSKVLIPHQCTLIPGPKPKGCLSNHWLPASSCLVDDTTLNTTTVQSPLQQLTLNYHGPL